jgi:Fe-S-cluster-containing dehydrogenase component
MANYGMMIDVDRCIGCYNCMLACRDEHAGNDYPGVALGQPQSGQKWIDVREQERGTYPKVKVTYTPVTCMHCEEASCISASTGGAVYRRADGIVLIDPEKAVGQREIVAACPHRVISWNEQKNIAQKCTMCAHLLDGGKRKPRCVEACPTGAIVFGDLDDAAGELAKLHAARAVEELHPEYGLKPRVGYFGLPMRFIAGELVFADEPERPARGVQVTLSRAGQTLSAASDGYGDFEFDGLEADGEYLLKVEHAGYRPYEKAFKTRTDLNVGAIVLHR